MINKAELTSPRLAGLNLGHPFQQVINKVDFANHILTSGGSWPPLCEGWGERGL